MDQETVGLEMTSAPVNCRSSIPSEEDSIVEIKRVSGCWVAGLGGWRQVEGVSETQKNMMLRGRFVVKDGTRHF